jgi:nitrite reductase/ring-hydroxylating ferredoxin subunit
MRCMADPGEWRCDVGDLPPGHTAKFRLTCGDRAHEGFALNHDGRYYAYLNLCAHVGTPLDLWPNDFMSEDGREIVCATHGALYEPESGLCTAGPCAGDHLTPLPVRVEGQTVVVSCAGP